MLCISQLENGISNFEFRIAEYHATLCEKYTMPKKILRYNIGIDSEWGLNKFFTQTQTVFSY